MAIFQEKGYRMSRIVHENKGLALTSNKSSANNISSNIPWREGRDESGNNHNYASRDNRDSSTKPV